MMDQLPVAIQLLLAGLIAGLASAFAGAAGGRKISFDTNSPAGELVAPSHKTMSQTTWYQNRGPATFGRLPLIGTRGNVNNLVPTKGSRPA